MTGNRLPLLPTQFPLFLKSISSARPPTVIRQSFPSVTSFCSCTIRRRPFSQPQSSRVALAAFPPGPRPAFSTTARSPPHRPAPPSDSQWRRDPAPPAGFRGVSWLREAGDTQFFLHLLLGCGDTTPPSLAAQPRGSHGLAGIEGDRAGGRSSFAACWPRGAEGARVASLGRCFSAMPWPLGLLGGPAASAYGGSPRALLGKPRSGQPVRALFLNCC